jgi:hypothetical protein
MARLQQMSRQEFPSTDPTRRGMTDVAYSYMDERFQTFMVTVPIEDDNEETVIALVQEKITAAESAGPKVIELP